MHSVIKKGVHFVVKSFTGRTEQEIIFTHRDEDKKPVEGLTRESLYRVLIENIEHANSRKWSAENDIQIKRLKQCLRSQEVTITAKINESKDNVC